MISFVSRTLSYFPAKIMTLMKFLKQRKKPLKEEEEKKEPNPMFPPPQMDPDGI